ncbi:MAG: cell division protein SepF [Clostridia bacterium]|nr:cell division protein SepF [Clostridia bacterium]MBQ9994215.1 cell division protein SepF [Clostridia bacterium]
MGIIGRFKDIWNGAEEEEEDFYDAYADEEFVETKQVTTQRIDRENKVVSIHATAQLQVVIVKPVRFEEVADIADHLIDKRTVVLNLEQTGKDISRRVVDFLSGAAYAHNGQLKRIANNTYIITPFNVGLIGADVLGELENNGVFF